MRHPPFSGLREHWDWKVIEGIALEKLAEISNQKIRLARMREKKQFALELMRSKPKYSYLWLLAWIAVYQFETEKMRLEKETLHWNKFLTQHKVSFGNQRDDLESLRSVRVEDLLDGKVISVGGGKLKALCPIHQEKTPSFIIYPDNSWHCFGCQVHGNNAIDFVMKAENLSFKEAISRLDSNR